MDWKDGLRKLDNKGDLVVTSPPYLNYRTYGKGKLFDDSKEWTLFCIHCIEASAKYALKDGGVIWWNTAHGYKNHRVIPSVYHMISSLLYNNLHLIDDIPWIKPSPPKSFKVRPYPSWEHNLIFSKNPKKVNYYVDQVRRPYKKSTLKRMKYNVSKLQATDDGNFDGDVKVKPNPLGASPPNYLELKQDTSRRPHPAPMSPDLANWAIRAYSKEGDLVIDPMCGIGTVCIEAKKLGRNYIGFEINKEYIDIAEMSFERLERGEDPYNGLRKEYENN